MFIKIYSKNYKFDQKIVKFVKFTTKFIEKIDRNLSFFKFGAVQALSLFGSKFQRFKVQKSCVDFKKCGNSQIKYAYSLNRGPRYRGEQAS